MHKGSLKCIQDLGKNIQWSILESKYLCGKEAHKWLIQDLERLGYKYIPEFSSDTGNIYVHMGKLLHLQGADEIDQMAKKILLDDFILFLLQMLHLTL